MQQVNDKSGSSKKDSANAEQTAAIATNLPRLHVRESGKSPLERAGYFLRSGYGAAIILVIAYCLALSGVARKSPTFDELTHLTGGYGIWLKHDFRLFPDNGNLPQRWGALPALWRHDQFPATNQDGWRRSNVYTIGDQLFYQMGNDPTGMMFEARACMALIIVAMGALIYFWSRSLFGTAGALTSVVLFALCPSVLGHGPLVTSDMMVTMFFLAALGSIWRLLHRVDIANILLAGLSLAGVLLAKASGVLILPMAAILLFVRLGNPEPLIIRWRGSRLATKTPAKLGILAAITLALLVMVLFCIWAAFDFRYSAFADDASLNRLFPGGWEPVLQKRGLVSAVVQPLRDGRLLPEAYLYGIGIVSSAAEARESFLNGQIGGRGFTEFFPYAFTVKETIPFLLALLLAAGAYVTARRAAGAGGAAMAEAYSRRRLYATSPLWVIIFVYGLVALKSHLNIGHRHLFPMYPALFVLAGAAGAWFSRRTLWQGGLVALLLAWHVVESLSVWPNYLTYFNEFAGGPKNGYHHLVDSSLDWGQDLPGLKEWLDTHNRGAGAAPVSLLYFGTARQEYYGIKATELPGFLDRLPAGPESLQPLKPGYFCISATHLQGLYLKFPGPWTEEEERVFQSQSDVVNGILAKSPNADTLKDLSPEDGQSLLEQFPRLRAARLCAWLRKQNTKPVAFIGNSIFVFKLDEKDLLAAQTQAIN